jgi:hypothetical protein
VTSAPLLEERWNLWQDSKDGDQDRFEVLVAYALTAVAQG